MFDGHECVSVFASEQVTCFEYASQLLPREDPDAAKCLEEVLLEDGLEIKLGWFVCVGWIASCLVCYIQPSVMRYPLSCTDSFKLCRADYIHLG